MCGIKVVYSTESKPYFLLALPRNTILHDFFYLGLFFFFMTLEKKMLFLNFSPLE